MPDSHAPAATASIVNHLGPDSFEKDGLRPFFEYRPLGLKELTGGKVGAPRNSPKRCRVSAATTTTSTTNTTTSTTTRVRCTI